MDKAIQIIMVTVVAAAIGATVLIIFQGGTDDFTGNMSSLQDNASVDAQCSYLKSQHALADDERQGEIEDTISDMDGCSLNDD